MSYYTDDTIAAISTASGAAARGMVRISGPDAVAIVARSFQADNGSSIQRLSCATAISGRLPIHMRDATHNSANNPAPLLFSHEKPHVPCDLFVWPTNRSYTREPLVELHTFGSRPVLESALAAFCRDGARLAEPGEFTLRAFLAGRLDLTQAEAVLGVIDAHGSDELGAALSQLAGGLAKPLHRLRDDLLQLLAELEAGLDFVDEDIEFVTPQELLKRLNAAVLLLDGLARQMASRHAAAIVNQVALIGPPNAGKSSLFNALVQRYGMGSETQQTRAAAALVSPLRGTTRDYLTATISLDGVDCELIDTAGVEDFDASRSDRPAMMQELDPARRTTQIDEAARAAAIERRRQATICVCCIESSKFALPEKPASRPLVEAAHCDVLVLTKVDLMPHAIRLPCSPAGAPVVVTSSHTGDGLSQLSETLRRLLVVEKAAQRGQAIASTAARCSESIRLASTAISRAAELIRAEGGNELVAVELRTALHELGKVVGAVYTDDLLDRIFSTFCIGK